jgi:hypothetical protein
VSEQYDEVVFTDPTENFKRLLLLYSTFSSDTRAAEAAGMVRAYKQYKYPHSTFCTCCDSSPNTSLMKLSLYYTIVAFRSTTPGSMILPIWTISLSFKIT